MRSHTLEKANKRYGPQIKQHFSYSSTESGQKIMHILSAVFNNNNKKTERTKGNTKILFKKNEQEEFIISL